MPIIRPHLLMAGGGGYQTPSYANTGGTGDRTGSITVTSGLGSPALGIISNLVNNDVTFTASGGVIWSAQSWVGKRIVFDFGTQKLITEFRISAGNSGNNHGTAKFGGSDDNSTYTYYGSAVTIVSDFGPTVYNGLSTNVTGYRYYCLEGVSGNYNDGTWLTEFEFKIGNAV